MIIELNSNINIIEPNIEILVIGFFDGLHKGHMSLMQEDLYKTSILTFKNVPNKKDLLYSDTERIKQLEKIGCKEIFVYDLVENITAEEFINKYLIKLSPQKIVVGSDFKFGKDFKDTNYLSQFFNVEVINRYNNISTSLIKKYILMGDFISANNCLIFPYYRIGNVINGSKNGAKLGARTANIKINPDLIKIPNGVYISSVLLNNYWYKSLTVVGKPKTNALKINHPESFIETHILDYNGKDFYDEKIKVIFLKKIGEIKNCVFKSLLIKRINKFKKISENFIYYKHEPKIN